MADRAAADGGAGPDVYRPGVAVAEVDAEFAFGSDTGGPHVAVGLAARDGDLGEADRFQPGRADQRALAAGDRPGGDRAGEHQIRVLRRPRGKQVNSCA